MRTTLTLDDDVAFIRIPTNSKAFVRPLSGMEAHEAVASWPRRADLAHAMIATADTGVTLQFSVLPITAKPDHAGVHVPPPLFFVAAIAAGAGLRRAMPFTIGGDAVRLVAAGVFVAFSAAILGWSFLSFARRHTTIIPNLPAKALVVEGPYRLTRNPMYLALTLLTAGAGLWLNTWWVLILLVPAVLAIDRLVIAREEAYLRRRFGPDYDAFTSRVRRWI